MRFKQWWFRNIEWWTERAREIIDNRWYGFKRWVKRNGQYYVYRLTGRIIK